MPGMNPTTGRWSRDGEEIDIAVRRAFATPKASRLMRRHLGVETAQLRDRPIEPGMLGPMTVALAESLRHEPRVKLRRLVVEKASRNGGVGVAAEIDIDGTRRRIGL